MRIKTNVKAGSISLNHGVKIKTHVKAGAITLNHGACVRA
jgi:hypothetical protein